MDIKWDPKQKKWHGVPPKFNDRPFRSGINFKGNPIQETRKNRRGVPPQKSTPDPSEYTAWQAELPHHGEVP